MLIYCYSRAKSSKPTVEPTAKPEAKSSKKPEAKSSKKWKDHFVLDAKSTKFYSQKQRAPKDKGKTYYLVCFFLFLYPGKANMQDDNKFDLN